jgi:hypothetical protein
MSIYPAQTTTQGSIFNPDLWVAGDTETIDAEYLSANYLKFPVSQGYETLNGMTNLGSTIFSSDVRFNSTIKDTSGDVGTAGQVLSSTGTGTNWIAASAGTTYISYSASATLSTSVNPTLLVVVSGATVGKVITIPSGYSLGQKIQIKNTGSVVASISTTNTVFIYSSTTILNSITLESGDVVNLIYNGFTWIQYTPTTNLTKLTSAGAITATTGNITASSGNIIGTLLRNAPNTASISSTGVVSGVSMASATFDAAADALAGATALTIGSNVVIGNIVIGAALSAGDISIATTQAAGGTVSIGSNNTETTLSGDVFVAGGGNFGTTGVLSGKTGYDTTSSNFTIPATINSTYILRITGGTPNINLPTAVIGQTIIIRSITTGAVTITATASAVIFASKSAVSVGSIALATAESITLYATTALQWIQI